jgi:hypothetical protein
VLLSLLATAVACVSLSLVVRQLDRHTGRKMAVGGRWSLVAADAAADAVYAIRSPNLHAAPPLVADAGSLVLTRRH